MIHLSLSKIDLISHYFQILGEWWYSLGKEEKEKYN